MAGSALKAEVTHREREAATLGRGVGAAHGNAERNECGDCEHAAEGERGRAIGRRSI